MKILKHLFGKRDKELDILQEEALQSPLRTVVKNFIHWWTDHIPDHIPDRFDRSDL